MIDPIQAAREAGARSERARIAALLHRQQATLHREIALLCERIAELERQIADAEMQGDGDA